VREDDHVGARRAFVAAFVRPLQQRIDRDAVLGEDAGDARQHAGFVGHLQAQVKRGHDFVDRQHRQVLHRRRLECEVRHAVVGVGRGQACDVDEVGDHRRGRGLCARALAVVERRADRVAVNHHGVHRPLDVGDQAPRWHQRRMHAQLDTARAGGSGRTPLRDREQLDAVAELLGIRDVGRLQLDDALDVRLGELHRDAECDRAHDRGLVRSVDAGDVEGRVGFGIAQLLRIGQCRGEVDALVAHFAQDEIRGAVDDPGDPFDAIRREPFAQGLDDRNAAGHRRFECHHHAALARRRENLGAVHGEQRLVGGDNVLARGDRLEHERLRDAGAADELDDHIDVAAPDHHARIGQHLGRVARHGPGARRVEIGHVRDADLAPGAPSDLFLVALQHGERATADHPRAEQPHEDRLHREFRAR